MTRIFEALQQAALEQEGEYGVIDFPGLTERVDSPKPLPELVLTKMTNLYRTIRSHLPSQSCRIVLVLGSSREADGSKLLRNLAKTVSEHLGRKVLLVDAGKNAAQFSHFSMEPTPRWSASLRPRQGLDSALRRIDGSNLYLARLDPSLEPIDDILEPGWINDQLKTVRLDFELVLIDCAPAIESADGMALSRIADGVVLVAEAEKTRWQVAQNVKEKIADQGGRMLGVILNRRKLHIPEFVYKRI